MLKASTSFKTPKSIFSIAVVKNKTKKNMFEFIYCKIICTVSHIIFKYFNTCLHFFQSQVCNVEKPIFYEQKNMVYPWKTEWTQTDGKYRTRNLLNNKCFNHNIYFTWRYFVFFDDEIAIGFIIFTGFVFH